MSSREERVSKNEATSREINERIQEAHEDAGSPDRHVRMVCECGHEDCDRVVAITLAEYEHVRSDPRQFVVLRGHVIPDVERVIGETDRFTLVSKRDGTPADVAIEENPRD